MRKLGVGIIGCGNISASYLALGPLFKALDLRAVADINMEAARARAAEFNLRAETVDGLLAADDIDMVVNLTIPAAHFEITKRILEAGKHAYSEKPMVLSLAEGKELVALARAKGLRLGSAPDTFFGGAHQTARAVIDEGQLGQVVAGSCHVMSRGMESWHPNPDFFFQPGGGPILDLGPYYITNLVQLIGPVRAVTALANAAFPTRTIGNGPRQGEGVPVDTPTNIHALLEFHNGATVTFSASWDIVANRHSNMEIYGTQGTLYVPDPNFFGGDLDMVTLNGSQSALRIDHHPFGVTNMSDGQGQARANYRCAGLADMAQAITENRPHRCNAELALHVVDVMVSILRAGESRTWVETSTTCERPAALSAAEAKALLA